MVFFVSGWKEELVLQKALAEYFANATNADDVERAAKMLERALVCSAKQGQKKSHGRSRD